LKPIYSIIFRYVLISSGGLIIHMAITNNFKQKSIIDYIITDGDSRKAFGDVLVDSSDIGCSEYF